MTFRSACLENTLTGSNTGPYRTTEISHRGIDPGNTTIGIASFDLNGELVKVQSPRQMTMADVIELIWSLGKPIVVASDVVPMPFTVEKIRRAFQAVPYTPRQDISVETKYDCRQIRIWE